MMSSDLAFDLASDSAGALETPEASALKQASVISIEASAPWAQWHQYFSNNSLGAPISRYAVEMGVLLEGRLRRHYQGWSMDVEPGQTWMIGMWETQNWEIIEGPCREVVFFISPEVLLNLHLPEMPEVQWLRPFMISPQLRPQVAPHARAHVRNLAQQVVELRRQWRVEARTQIETAKLAAWNMDGHAREPLAASETACVQLRLIMIQLLMCLMDGWRPTSEAMRLEPFSQISPAIERALQTRDLVTLNEAARLCGLNRNLFSRRFRQMMGMSYPEFSLHHRLKGVTNDLEARHETIEIIAVRWGFVNGSHLHRRFVRHFGCTPAQYRRLQRERRLGHWNTPLYPVLLWHPRLDLTNPI